MRKKDKFILGCLIVVWILSILLIVIGVINENKDAVELKGHIRTEMKYDGYSIDNFEVVDTESGRDIIIHFIEEK